MQPWAWQGMAPIDGGVVEQNAADIEAESGQ